MEGLLKTLESFELAVSKARVSGEDISADYHKKTDTTGYKLQEDLRLGSQSLVFDYECMIDMCPSNVMNYTRKILSLVGDAKSLFGNHPFHHVMEGRLARLVKISLRHHIPIPDEFRAFFDKFVPRPWNNPTWNYNTPRDALSQNRPEAIPPDWKA